ncbi:hypothetical protein KAFR_0B02290 [Kazachstania africana CBS 2517]|uniref:HhH-GPD domain-containing protein n=1 Tax=Kazachstania africana (strain ATCC 22294 / BCRC 22015 / CBS 2517 / CECT 1963 / NBRC 1671 / NRRL Y-8276) TaxID=1071382 RepID=H2AQ77_KAZAF|nr:hypothetical protein KAFR_0B02290 [Kazachstania africana CBS 2517]CCF56527.1 hypothetical protein KAFR_0B02290 [Kazachstania africana CBS 2517]
MKRTHDDTVKEEEGDCENQLPVQVEDEPIRTELSEEFLKRHSDLFGEACAFITKVDPTLIETIEYSDFPLFKRPQDGEKSTLALQDYFVKLGGAIIGQQISNIAAKNIRGRFCDYFGGIFPSYKRLLETLAVPAQKAEVKACGLSARKLEYLESLASYFAENEEHITDLFHKGDENDQEVVDDLVGGIKGIGPWTAKMFLVTGLKRFDVFAPEDVGVARGFSKYISMKDPKSVAKYNLNRKGVKKSKIKHKKTNWKIYDDDVMEEYAKIFSPYRTIFMFILWRLSGAHIDAMIKVEKEFTSDS